MSDNEQHGFDATKIFIALLILTLVEVGWSFIPGISKFFLWGGLLTMAFMKGFLIFTYFMHMKFEGWVVKALIAPTPILIIVVIFALMPDVGSNSRMDHDLTDMADPATGQIIQLGSNDDEHPEEEDSGH
jgi:cytochrome c oxidase subunit IV